MKKVTLVYFSPTGNTKKSLEAMSEGLGGIDERVDLTVMTDKAFERHFEKDDVVLLGMPVYGGRIPAVARKRLEGISGEGTDCLVVVTYGNRHYDDALLELADWAEEHGFRVMGAAALVGRHTYGEIQTDRPDENDLAADRKFAVRALSRGENAPAVEVPGNRPYRDGGNGGKFRPLTSDACIRCGLCVKKCPMHAIADDCRTISDACISCFRCIRICPKGAKNMDVEAYRNFAVAFTEKLKARRENEYYC